MSKVQLFTAVTPSNVQFSKPVKTASAYKISPVDMPMIQTDHVLFQSPLADGGDTLSKVTLRISQKLHDWIKATEKHVLQYTKDNKASIFHESVTDAFIESGFQTSLGKDMCLVARTSKEVAVYAGDKTTLSVQSVATGTRASVLLAMHSVEFGKKTFGIKWVLMAVKMTTETPYCFVEEDLVESSESESEEEPILQEKNLNE